MPAPSELQVDARTTAPISSPVAIAMATMTTTPTMSPMAVAEPTPVNGLDRGIAQIKSLSGTEIRKGRRTNGATAYKK